MTMDVKGVALLYFETKSKFSYKDICIWLGKAKYLALVERPRATLYLIQPILVSKAIKVTQFVNQL